MHWISFFRIQSHQIFADHQIFWHDFVTSKIGNAVHLHSQSTYLKGEKSQSQIQNQQYLALCFFFSFYVFCVSNLRVNIRQLYRLIYIIGSLLCLFWLLRKWLAQNLCMHIPYTEKCHLLAANELHLLRKWVFVVNVSYPFICTSFQSDSFMQIAYKYINIMRNCIPQNIVQTDSSNGRIWYFVGPSINPDIYTSHTYKIGKHILRFVCNWNVFHFGLISFSSIHPKIKLYRITWRLLSLAITDAVYLATVSK